MTTKKRRRPTLSQAQVHLCDYRSLSPAPEDEKAAEKDSADVPADLREQMHTHLLAEALVRQIAEKSEVSLPTALVEDRASSMAMALEARLAADSHSLEDYYAAIGTSEAGLMGDMRAEARRQLTSRAILLAIARQEGLTASEDDLKNEVKRLTTRYPLTEDQIRHLLTTSGDEVALREDIAIEHAAEFVETLVSQG